MASPPESDPKPQVPPRPERRVARLQIIPCERCARDRVTVTLRTEYVLYVQCDHCGHTWTMLKPSALH